MAREAPNETKVSDGWSGRGDRVVGLLVRKAVAVTEEVVRSTEGLGVCG